MDIGNREIVMTDPTADLTPAEAELVRMARESSPLPCCAGRVFVTEVSLKEGTMTLQEIHVMPCKAVARFQPEPWPWEKTI